MEPFCKIFCDNSDTASALPFASLPRTTIPGAQLVPESVSGISQGLPDCPAATFLAQNLNAVYLPGSPIRTLCCAQQDMARPLLLFFNGHPTSPLSSDGPYNTTPAEEKSVL